MEYTKWLTHEWINMVVDYPFCSIPMGYINIKELGDISITSLVANLIGQWYEYGWSVGKKEVVYLLYRRKYKTMSFLCTERNDSIDILCMDRTKEIIDLLNAGV